MNDKKAPTDWKYTSPTSRGLHLVVSPDNSACVRTWIYRLNLPAGATQTLDQDLPGAPGNRSLELNALVTAGRVSISEARTATGKTLGPLDSWYQTPAESVTVEALEDAALFVGGAPFEDRGTFYVRPYDPKIPLGEIRQVHGKPPYRRDVFMTINQEQEASCMINGVTWGDDGGWTSWPPHQHTAHLEEVYCYFNIPSPRYALHFASRQAGTVEAIHRVSTGDCVVIPEGYHPTCGTPGIRSCYFWVMAAHRPESRRYDLAVPDPNFPV